MIPTVKMEHIKRFLCSAAIFFAATTLRADLDEELVAYWPFDTVGIDHTPDIVGGNNLHLHNLTRTNLSPGRFGNAMFLDGATQFMALNYAEHRKLPLTVCKDFTVSLWVRGPGGQKNRIVFAEGLTTDRVPLFVLGTNLKGESDSLNVLVRGLNENFTIDNLTAEAIVYDDEWHHITWIDENGIAKLFIDGKLDVTSYDYERKNTRLNYLSFGALLRTPPVYFFKGAIDDAAIWRRALTRKEIQAVMDGDLPAVLDKKKGSPDQKLSEGTQQSKSP